MNLGKPRRSLMNEAIYRLRGAESPLALVGPGPGLDTTVLKITNRRVMVASTDPISYIPSLGTERSAWLSVHATASDIATSGLSPQCAIFDLNLPPTMSDRTLREYWKAIHKTCFRLGISVVGGHTGRFEGCDYTVVGGVTMFSFGKRTGYVTAGMARKGDDLIVTKGAAIEGTAVLALSFPKTLENKFGKSTVKKASKLLEEVSTIEDALCASKVGLRTRGVTAMHDVTEGGVLSAILELADASGLKAIVHQNEIPVYTEVQAVCRYFRLDPLITLGQGSLVIASRPDKTERVQAALRRKRIKSSVVGSLTKGRNHTILREGVSRLLKYPRRDPYWAAYWLGVRRGLQ